MRKPNGAVGRYRPKAARSAQLMPHGVVKEEEERKARALRIAEAKTPSGPKADTLLNPPPPGFKRARNRHVNITMTLPICYGILSM